MGFSMVDAGMLLCIKVDTGIVLQEGLVCLGAALSRDHLWQNLHAVIMPYQSGRSRAHSVMGVSEVTCWP